MIPIPKAASSAQDHAVPWRALAACAALALALRTALYGGLDVYADEALYWWWSTDLAGGYFDHPPMVAWLHALGFGHDGLRWPARLMGAGSVVVAGLLALRLGATRSGAISASLICAFAPMLAYTGGLALPDAPEELFASLALLYLLTAQGRTWLLAGVFVGLGLLSKYTMGLWAFALIAMVPLDARLRAQLKGAWPWLGWAVSLLVFAPCALWNAQHDWVSFAFQFEHGVGQASTMRFAPEFWAAQVVGFGPFACILAWFGWRRLEPGSVRQRLLALVGVTLVLFLVLSLRGKQEANWATFLFPALAALAGLGVSKARRWMVHASVVWGLLLMGFFGWQLRSPSVLSPNNPQIKRLHATSEISRRVEQVLGAPDDPLIWVSNYQLAAQLAYTNGWRRFGSSWARPSQISLKPAPGVPDALVSYQPAPQALLDEHGLERVGAADRIELARNGVKTHTVWVQRVARKQP